MDDVTWRDTLEDNIRAILSDMYNKAQEDRNNLQKQGIVNSSTLEVMRIILTWRLKREAEGMRSKERKIGNER